MLMNDDIESLNMIIGYSNDMIEGKKDIEEYYDDILKELLVIRGYNKNKVYEYIGCGELISVIDIYGKNEIMKEMSIRNE